MGDYNFPDIDWNSWNSPGESTESNEFKFIENLQENFLFQHVLLSQQDGEELIHHTYWT